ncbi:MULTISPECIES: hypothetical protein [unclassified Microcoleus]|uniref:hypothetical protein n=1 Tax=unclassified Microcoleus TaxID=2642155 RepID=UPI002FD43E43
MAGKFIKGALVEFMETFLIPLPNVIVFQFNPETITHTWTQPESVRAQNAEGDINPLAVKGVPGESFSFTILMDANDVIADGSPVAKGIAEVSGIYSRLAALEMLQFPTQAAAGTKLVGSVSLSVGSQGASASVSASASASAPKRDIPVMQVPTVLFVWGPGRIVPVRVTNLTITEKLYDSLLNPIHAEAQIGLRVLTPEELKFVTGDLSEIAKGAYTYSQGLRQALAIANLGNAAESIIGMLPI